jgi:hypothetical protein
VIREKKAIKENAESKVLPVKLCIQIILEMGIHQMDKDLKDHKVRKVQPDAMVLMERMVQMEKMAHQVKMA